METELQCMQPGALTAAVTALRCVCLLFLTSLSGQSTNWRNILTDTGSQHCYSGNESAVLNRIAFPQPPVTPPPHPSIFATVSRHSQRLWILIVYQTAKVKLTVVISGQFQQSHQHHIPCTKLTPAAFPEMRVCFGLLCGLAFTGFFSEEVDLSEFECSFRLTEHVRVGIPMLRGHRSMPMVHFKAYFFVVGLLNATLFNACLSDGLTSKAFYTT